MLWADENLQLFFFFYHSVMTILQFFLSLSLFWTLLLKITGETTANTPEKPFPPRPGSASLACLRCAVLCVRVCVSRESFKPVQVCPGERQCTAPDGQVAAEITGEIETLSDRQPCIRREHTCHRKVDKHTLVDDAQKRPSAYKKK